jgi:hypothetical protein
MSITVLGQCEFESAILPSRATFSVTCAAECVAEHSGEDTLDVSIPRAPSDEQARREVAIYLQAWQAMNLGARAEIVA